MLFRSGEDKVGFQRQRVFLFGVVRVDVQRIDVIRADRRNADDLTTELLHKGEILGFGVTDDDVMVLHIFGAGTTPDILTRHYLRQHNTGLPVSVPSEQGYI